jgi:hypothetical protein
MCLDHPQEKHRKQKKVRFEWMFFPMVFGEIKYKMKVSYVFPAKDSYE